MKNYIKRISIIVLCVVFLSILCSCDLDESRNNFSGGDLLDVEKLSELKDSIMTEESEIAETEKEKQTQDNESVKYNTEPESTSKIEDTANEEITNDVVTEGSTETSLGNDEESVSDSESEELSETEIANKDELVYWTEAGKVWHLSPDCHHLKNSEKILSGTIEEAMAAKKTKLCSSCEK